MAETSLHDFLLENTNVELFGACLPRRASFLDCFTPAYHTYPQRRPGPPSCERVVQEAMPGASARYLEDEKAWVYDRDITTIWKLPTAGSAYEICF